MPLTPEEITAIQAQAEGEELNHESIKPLMDLGLVIRTKKAEESFKTNYFNTEYAKQDAAAYKNVQDSVKELTGVEPNANEKASEYVKRALGADKEARKTLTTELEKLRKEKTDGNGNTDKDKRIEQLETLLQSKDKEYKEELTKKEQEKLDIRVGSQAETALAIIKAGLRKSIDASIQDDILEARDAKLRKNYTPRVDDKGNIVWVDNAKGEVVNNETTFKPLSTRELYQQFFKDLQEEKKEQGGAGSGKSKTEGNQGGGTKEVPAPGPEIDTQVKLTTYLKEHGLATSTKEFDEAFEKYKGDKKLR